MKRESIYKSAAVIVFTSFASYLLIYKLIPALQKISSKESEKNFLKNEYQLKYSNTQFNLNLVNTDNSYVSVAKQFLFPFSKCFSENFVSKLKPQSSHSVIHIEFLLAQYLKDLFFGLINKEKSKINLFSGKRTLTEKEFVQIFQSNQFIRSFTMFLVSKSNKIIYFPFLMINCLNHKVTVSILDFIEKEKILTKNKEKEHGIIHLPEVLVVFLEDFVDSKNFDLENETVFCLYNMKYVLVSFCVYLNQDYYLYQRNNKKWYEFSHQMIEIDINLFKQGKLIFVTYEKILE